MNSEQSNSRSLELILEKLFDHSGTFPPANKGLEDALRDAAGFSRMLVRPHILGAHLVVDEASLQTLTSWNLMLLGFSPNAEVRLCVLADHDSGNLCRLLHRIHTSKRDDTIRLVVNSIELKLSREIVSSPDTLQLVFNELRGALPDPGTLIAIEPDLSRDDWETLLNSVVSFLDGKAGGGLKCRCTGTSGIDANRLASCIAATADREIPFKVTGGLHHPIVEISRWGNSIGFLNVVAAVTLRRHLRAQFSIDVIARLLGNDRADAFDLSSGLSYRNHRISFDELHRARSGKHLSIGSCSLDEPDRDLLRLFGAPEDV